MPNKCEQCSGCAFLDGTNANGETVSTLKADIRHFKKVPDPNLTDYGNRNFETLSEYEKCTKGFTLTIIIEEN